jgi:hypothetical protein
MPSTAGGRARGIAVLAIVADVSTTGRGLALTYAAQSENLLHQARALDGRPSLHYGFHASRLRGLRAQGPGTRAARTRRTGRASRALPDQE